ncbi:ATP-binding protein [Pseudomonas psychrophila]|uniref:ATP-binding protein n=1 Tax=Pseudomonas psychrophila TaxID=122355 RepID=UPI000474D409|nr:winged helix-turn-helix domain-containing protein [Pseudomonas psychrophila]
MMLCPEQVVHFGPYRVYPRQRLIVDAEQPLRLGRRAMDILLLLLEHPGSVVSKQQLIARLWPNSVVEEINLRVHMAALRKALGDGQNGQRFIVTVAQRGYSFVGELTKDGHAPLIPNPPANTPRHNLPLRRTRVIGRQAVLGNLLQHLARQRFITLTGPGGIGKTTVALQAAEQLIGHYPHGIHLLDLAPISDPALITPLLATLLGLPLHDSRCTTQLTSLLHDRHLLLVIDNCEHLIHAVAELCESVLRGAPRVHILATSREALRAEGEYLQRLDGLDYPPALPRLERSHALSFAALQLFIERATGNHEHFELHTEQLPLLIDICRRLDGIPLAIELAAAHIGPLGLEGVLLQLQSNLDLLTDGAQAPLARHQTLRATLDWSHALLSPHEQVCLRRLSLFRGAFTLHCATAVTGDNTLEPGAVCNAISQLVAKSLLTVQVGDNEVLYRLLETTRSYAQEKLDQPAEHHATRQRLAECCLKLMQQAQHTWEQTPTGLWIERYAHCLEDVRATLDWGFSAQGPHMLAITLTAVSTPLWQELSLPREHGAYVRKALRLLEATKQPSPLLAMALKLALGNASYHARGGIPATHDAFASARTLAQTCNDRVAELRAVSGHMAANLLCGNYQEALEQSRQCDQLGLHSAPDLSLSTDRLRGLALHFAGEQVLARSNAEQVLQRMAHNGHRNRFTSGFGVQYDQSVAALTLLARILWLQGQPESAWRTARQALDIALQINHSTSICYTLTLAGCPIAHYNGDHPTAQELLHLLLEQSQLHAVHLFYTWGRHYAQVIAPDSAPAPLHPDDGLIKHMVLTLNGGAIDDTLLQRARTGAAGWCGAEILRLRAIDLHATDDPDTAQALLLEALALASRQGALAWQLRSATSLAKLWQQQGQVQQAHALLAPIYHRYTEGLETPALTDVRHLLDRLQCDN